MPRIEFDPQPLRAYERIEKSGAVRLLDLIDDVLDALEANPGEALARRRSFGDGLWGIPVRDRSEDWLVIWELEPGADTIVVRYPGIDPFG